MLSPRVENDDEVPQLELEGFAHHDYSPAFAGLELGEHTVSDRPEAVDTVEGHNGDTEWVNLD